MFISSRHVAFIAPLLLAGCGWFSSGPAPGSTPPRPGADRQATVQGLPAATDHAAYDGSERPGEDARDQTIGSVVAGKGGQKAQIEAAEKERAKVDAEREKQRALNEREEAKPTAREGGPAAPPSAAPAAAATPVAVPDASATTPAAAPSAAPPSAAPPAPAPTE